MNLKTIIRCTLSGVTLGVAIACAESATPTAPRSVELAQADVHHADHKGPKVATCGVQKEEWKTERIDRRGGTVKVGGVSLKVPRGALSSPVSITAHTLPTATASVEFSPEGLRFTKSATLQLSYSKCVTPFVGVTVVYVQADTVAEIMQSHDQPIKKFVTAKIDHFSSYAVAY
jgi:hypothetical protein